MRHLQIVSSIVVPGFATLEQPRRERCLHIIDDALGERPESMRRQLALFLRVLNIAPYFRWGRSLARVDTVASERYLRWFQDAPIAKIRQGFWGLKTLIFMGYYGQSEVWPELGYAPDIDSPEVHDV